MGRRGRTRRLRVGSDLYLWSVRHVHAPDEEPGCREVLTIRRGRAGVRILFPAGPGRFVGDGLVPTGTVMAAGGPTVNLHEPRHVRTLLDGARAAGWDPDTAWITDLDGWSLLERHAST
ncbi:hypothetical protein J4H86_03760 [Spiractinospora alimapuensis]|uniref:hypothetical protein n=1 Tax=Spiractinospora alimapuensis TaxID=2820884 RepID=UPI001F3B866D|nr:hypothetical protein [Spiractinospora alimapuensis]QVQ52943.1 hypothetical protein J4H86_03760 [Spiractinospora alimapuensis]